LAVAIRVLPFAGEAKTNIPCTRELTLAASKKVGGKPVMLCGEFHTVGSCHIILPDPAVSISHHHFFFSWEGAKSGGYIGRSHLNFALRRRSGVEALCALFAGCIEAVY
jgi:hypothetical protein